MSLICNLYILQPTPPQEMSILDLIILVLCSLSLFCLWCLLGGKSADDEDENPWVFLLMQLSYQSEGCILVELVRHLNRGSPPLYKNHDDGFPPVILDLVRKKVALPNGQHFLSLILGHPSVKDIFTWKQIEQLKR